MKKTFGQAPMRLQAIVEQFFIDEGWSMEPLGDSFTWGTRYGGAHGDWPCVAWIPDEKEIFVFYSIFPEEIAQAAYGRCADFTCRVNFGMLIGAFELDWDTGELRLRTSVNVEGITSPRPLLQHVVYTNVVTMDRYYRALQAILTDGVDVAEALEPVEQD